MTVVFIPLLFQMCVLNNKGGNSQFESLFNLEIFNIMKRIIYQSIIMFLSLQFNDLICNVWYSTNNVVPTKTTLCTDNGW